MWDDLNSIFLNQAFLPRQKSRMKNLKLKHKKRKKVPAPLVDLQKIGRRKACFAFNFDYSGGVDWFQECFGFQDKLQFSITQVNAMKYIAEITGKVYGHGHSFRAWDLDILVFKQITRDLPWISK